ncbi:hypothetical protein V8E53_001496 [Lactarius tabidus]
MEMELLDECNALAESTDDISEDDDDDDNNKAGRPTQPTLACANFSCYHSSLAVPSEQVAFDDPDHWERNMDDLILRVAIWQHEHWVDRSAFLKVEQSSERTKDAVSCAAEPQW